MADPNARGKCVRYSFTTEISSMGKVPSSTMVDFGIIVPPPEISRKMQLQEGVTVYCFTRVLPPVPLPQPHPGSGADP